jgi:hypothetical protein
LSQGLLIAAAAAPADLSGGHREHVSGPGLTTPEGLLGGWGAAASNQSGG